MASFDELVKGGVNLDYLISGEGGPFIKEEAKQKSVSQILQEHREQLIREAREELRKEFKK